MLNEPLYKALTKIFGEPPKIVNENVPAEIMYPPPVTTFTFAETPIPASKIIGGEQYYVCCPFCGDTRYRLNFSYLCDAKISLGSVVYHCTPSLMRCYNEECQKVPANKQAMIGSIRAMLGDVKSLQAVDITKPSENLEDTDRLVNHVPLPPGLRDITDNMVPEYVRKYWLQERRFSVDTLNQFGVKFTYLQFPVKHGAPLCQQMVTIIPVIQNGDYWFYQIRMIPFGGNPAAGYECDQFGSELPRYIIPKGSKKNWALYNIDKAQFFKTVYLVEGPTDVWRVGNQAVARFGKTLSSAQISQMTTKLAGKRLVLVPDMDDPQAAELAIKQRQILKDTGSFTSVEIAKLPNGMDPGEIITKKGEKVCDILEGCITSPESVVPSLSGIQVTLY